MDIERGIRESVKDLGYDQQTEGSVFIVSRARPSEARQACREGLARKTKSIGRAVVLRLRSRHYIATSDQLHGHCTCRPKAN